MLNDRVDKDISKFSVFKHEKLKNYNDERFSIRKLTSLAHSNLLLLHISKELNFY
jgi:hypothetical protein